MFLGHYHKKHNSKVIKFNVSGAVHHSRWMAKAVYSVTFLPFKNGYYISSIIANQSKNKNVF